MSTDTITIADIPRTTKRRRRKGFAILAGLSLLGIVGASAASLGGITAQSLGADAQVVASCDTDGITVGTYNPAYDSTSGAYKASTSLTLGGVNAACNGKAYKVTLRSASPGNASLGEATGAALTVVAGNATVTFPTAIDAKSIEGVAVVIHG